MDWAKVGKHVFESSETPIGSIERKAMIQNLAVHMKHYGLRTSGFSEKASADPDRPGESKAIELKFGELDRLALEMIQQEEDAKLSATKYHGWPAPDSLLWVEYGIRFGNYLVVVTNWEGEVRIHTLHTSGEPVYWERYDFKRVYWYAQNTGMGKGSKFRIPDTKCTYDDFVAVMKRRCGPKIVDHLKREIGGFGI